MPRLFRRMFAMQTVQERAHREQIENARAIFEGERALVHKRYELALLRKRQAHLSTITGVMA